MQPPFPSPTATWHNESSAAVNPSNSNLSQTGKTVIITGAGSGIGRATALAFAKAQAARLILIGRTESTPQETKKLLGDSKSDCMIFPVPATDETAMQNVAKRVGAWDVLVLAPAHISSPSLLRRTQICSRVNPGMTDAGIFRGSGADPPRLPMNSDKCVSERARTNANYFATEHSANFLV